LRGIKGSITDTLAFQSMREDKQQLDYIFSDFYSLSGGPDLKAPEPPAQCDCACYGIGLAPGLFTPPGPTPSFSCCINFRAFPSSIVPFVWPVGPAIPPGFNLGGAARVVAPDLGSVLAPGPAAVGLEVLGPRAPGILNIEVSPLPGPPLSSSDLSSLPSTFGLSPLGLSVFSGLSVFPPSGLFGLLG